MRSAWRRRVSTRSRSPRCSAAALSATRARSRSPRASNDAAQSTCVRATQVGLDNCHLLSRCRIEQRIGPFVLAQRIMEQRQQAIDRAEVHAADQQIDPRVPRQPIDEAAAVHLTSQPGNDLRPEHDAELKGRIICEVLERRDRQGPFAHDRGHRAGTARRPPSPARALADDRHRRVHRWRLPDRSSSHARD